MNICPPMLLRWVAVPSLCLILGAAAARMAGAAAGDEVVVRLGKAEITATMLQNFVATLDPDLRRQALQSTDEMNRLMQLEIARIVVYNEAKAKKWDQRPDVKAQIERARDLAIVNTYLAAQAAPPNDYPSAADIEAAYNLNRDSFMQPRQYWLQQIFISSPAGSDPQAAAAAQKKADEVDAKAKAPGAKFDDLARSFSDKKDSAAKGGDLGWVPESELLPPIRNQVAGMNKGDVSDPIHVSDGWQIVRLVDTKPAAPRPLDDVKSAIVTALRQRQTQANEQTYVDNLLKQTPVSVNETALHRLFAAQR